VGHRDVLATLADGASPVALRRAREPDLPAIIGLLAADQLGATRDGVRSPGDLAAYPAAFRGVSAAMFGWAIGEARRRGYAMVQLTTDKSRGHAHRFYERLGFVASHEGMKLLL
jgi:GNAT superfamily N-acetyltransferase